MISCYSCFMAWFVLNPTKVNGYEFWDPAGRFNASQQKRLCSLLLFGNAKLLTVGQNLLSLWCYTPNATNSENTNSISCFSVAVMRHHDQGNIQKKELILACGSRSMSPTRQGGIRAGGHRCRRQNLRGHIFKAWDGQVGSSWVFFYSQSQPQETNFL